MRRKTGIRRMSIGALASLLVALSLGCGGNGKFGTEAESDSITEDLSWAVANPDAPRPGDKAPALAIEETLNGPAEGDADWAMLKGKATVLEFWATWCAPCVDVIPHLNGLAAELPADDIRFVSVTDEEAGTVTPFLESIPISGVVALDLDKSVFRDYGVQSIPTTFLVDKEGVIQAVTRAHDLTRDDLLDLIAGRRPDVPEIEDFGEIFDLGDEGEGPEPLFQVLIRPSTRAEGGMSRSPREIKLIAYSPEMVLRVAYGVGGGRLLIETELPDQKYDVVVNTAGRSELLDPMIQQAVAAVLGIEAVWEERVVDALVLETTADVKLKPLGPSDRTSYGWRSSMDSITATDLGGLVGSVASVLNQPVLDETGLEGRYKIDLKFDVQNDPESLLRAIEDTLGLSIVSEPRPIEMLVVTERAAEGSG